VKKHKATKKREKKNENLKKNKLKNEGTKIMIKEMKNGHKLWRIII